MRETPVWKALARTVAELNEPEVPFTVAGALALGHHQTRFRELWPAAQVNEEY